jgi:uncharacterized Tic20 family protein
MKQPDLGLKVTELRLQKKITQEKLAELCEVSTRTIQRIESGEVDPRKFTLSMLSDILEFDFGEDNTENENVWLVILHLSSIICMLVIPLLIWSWKKTQSYKIDKQGRQVLNFQITMILILFAGGCLLMLAPAMLAILGESGMAAEQSRPVLLWLNVCLPMPLVLVGIFCTYEGLVNAMRAVADKPVYYPLSIPFVK